MLSFCIVVKIFITYSEPEQVEALENFKRDNVSFEFFDTKSSKKKKAFALKSHWGARLDPFVLITDNDKPLKVMYSEDDPNVINSLINYLS